MALRPYATSVPPIRNGRPLIFATQSTQDGWKDLDSWSPRTSFRQVLVTGTCADFTILDGIYRSPPSLTMLELLKPWSDGNTLLAVIGSKPQTREAISVSGTIRRA